MSDQLKSAIVRILSDAGKVVGAGFLANENTVLTCAHVVAQALGVSQAAAEMPSVGVEFDFTLVAPGNVFSARVVCWFPVQTGTLGGATTADKSEDIAVLELSAKLPVGSKPVRLIELPDLWGHPFRAFGFPASHDTAAWASRLLRDTHTS